MLERISLETQAEDRSEEEVMERVGGEQFCGKSRQQGSSEKEVKESWEGTVMRLAQTRPGR